MPRNKATKRADSPTELSVWLIRHRNSLRVQIGKALSIGDLAVADDLKDELADEIRLDRETHPRLYESRS